MKIHSMLALMIVFLLFTGCQTDSNDPVSSTIETTTIEKTDPNAGGVFPYMQEFLYVQQTQYSVNGTNIEMEITNRNIFNRGKHFLVEINYSQSRLMIYINKPSTMSFTIPYLGTPDVVSVELYCVMEY